MVAERYLPAITIGLRVVLVAPHFNN